MNIFDELSELNIDNMSQKEKDLLRSSVLFGDEKLYVRFNGNFGNFPVDVDIPVYSRSAKRTALKYPYPKRRAGDLGVCDKRVDRCAGAEARE